MFCIFIGARYCFSLKCKLNLRRHKRYIHFLFQFQVAEFVESDVANDLVKAKQHKNKIFGVNYIGKLEKSDGAMKTVVRHMPGYSVAQGLVTVGKAIVDGCKFLIKCYQFYTFVLLIIVLLFLY